jgi:hypothetical protein
MVSRQTGTVPEDPGACVFRTQPTQEVAMNYRPTVAKAALLLAVTLVPGALYAGVVTGSATAVAWDAQDGNVTGITNVWEKQLLRHNSGTLHNFIGNPNELPPGACRALGHRWNIAVFMGRPSSYFEKKLLPRMAQSNCRFAFERVDLPNADGSYDLKVIGPAAQ